MEPDAILALAERAARSVRKRHELAWTAEDFEDACQAGAEGIIRALRDAPDKGEGYFFNAGRQAASRYAFRHTSVAAQTLTCADGGSREDGAAVNGISRGWSEPIEDAQLPQLRQVLSRVVRKDGARGGPKTRDQLAVARDLIILVGLSRGLSQTEIGADLSVPATHIHKYRQSIRRRLSAYKERSNESAMAE